MDGMTVESASGTPLATHVGGPAQDGPTDLRAVPSEPFDIEPPYDAAASSDLPGDRFLVETDAPYLTPEPMRKQKTNEPALVVHVADAIAKVRNTTREEIDRLTTANVSRLFGWPTLTELPS